jgi:hypothetical protein
MGTSAMSLSGSGDGQSLGGLVSPRRYFSSFQGTTAGLGFRVLAALVLALSITLDARADLAISSFAQSDANNGWYTFDGTLTGVDVEGAAIAFGGLLDGLNTVAAFDGSFSITTYIPDGTSGLAYVYATAINGETAEPYSLPIETASGHEGGGEESGEPTYVSPGIDSFSLDSMGDGFYLLSGHVTGSAVAGASVAFYGELSGLSAAVDLDGYFFTVEYLPEQHFGLAYAEVVDFFGNSSGAWEFCVDIPELNPGDDEEPAYTPPTVNSFSQSDPFEGYCTFSGTLSGSDVAGATVTFSGVLDGYSATADANGSFSLYAFFPEGANGFANVQGIDGQGNSTEMSSLYVTISGPP